ncbi:MAG: EamA family transporter [Candidatus Moranbacteria bacterium]|nr:EamA family transporter [Candidatus Moranbacteria bacterium]
MNWIPFAFLGAIFQAVESGIKKKALQMQGMNNLIATIAFVFAGLLFAIFYVLDGGTLSLLQNLNQNFWMALFWMVALNIVAVWFNYKALDAAELSYLMPFMTLTSLSLIIPPMILLHEFPGMLSLVGIGVVVVGAVFMDWKFKKNFSDQEKEKHKNNRKGIMYFTMTALCYTFTPAIMKVVLVESGDVLFASSVVHILIGLGFIPLIFLMPATISVENGDGAKEKKKLSRKETRELIMTNLKSASARNFLIATLLAGTAIAISNGGINYALKFAAVANVFAIKRTMPLFAFLIGVFCFKERDNLWQKIIATAIMVVGAIIITYSK